MNGLTGRDGLGAASGRRRRDALSAARGLAIALFLSMSFWAAVVWVSSLLARDLLAR